MKVRVAMDSVDINLGNNGIVLEIADNSGKHVGKLRVGQATVEWCKGRKRMGNGQRIALDKFVSEHLDKL